jgi:hypothetical protein
MQIFAYEIPKVNLPNKLKPTITLFSAQSIIVDNAKKYKLTWKTENSTHVQITYLGNVELSGNVIITEKEYLRGPITLTATSTKNSFSDSKTINKFSKADQEAPIIIRKETQNINQEFYSPMPYNRRYVRPRRYRRY